MKTYIVGVSVARVGKRFSAVQHTGLTVAVKDPSSLSVPTLISLDYGPEVFHRKGGSEGSKEIDIGKASPLVASYVDPAAARRNDRTELAFQFETKAASAREAADVVIKRALKLVAEHMPVYNLATGNCRHFCRRVLEDARDHGLGLRDTSLVVRPEAFALLADTLADDPWRWTLGATIMVALLAVVVLAVFAVKYLKGWLQRRSHARAASTGHPRATSTPLPARITVPPVTTDDAVP